MRSSMPPWPGISAERPSRRRCASASTRTDRRRCPSATIVSAEQRREARPAAAAATTRPTTANSSVADHEAADRAFDGLLRADRRRQRPPAERAAGVVLRRVADDHREHQQEQRPRPAERRGWPPARRAAGRCRATERAPPKPSPARRPRRATRQRRARPTATSAVISTTSNGPGTAAACRPPARWRHRPALRRAHVEARVPAPSARQLRCTREDGEQQQSGDGEEQPAEARTRRSATRDAATQARALADDADHAERRVAARREATHLAPSATGDCLMPP